MLKHKLYFVMILALLPLILARVVAGQPQSPESYLLLRNGNVLKGTIRAEKERISISADGNSTIFVEQKQVSFIGPTLESLYEHQRSGVRQWGSGEHWHLAHWCIQQGLLDRAIEHYTVLEDSASDSPRFKQLEHLLRAALLADENVKKAVHKQSHESSTTSAFNAAKQQESNSVTQASAETPRLRSVTEINAISSEQWKKHEIPGYIRKTFQSAIVPVLTQRCGQSGCHGLMGKSDFHLYQPAGDQAVSILAKDLDEVLKYIDRERVQDSPLLAYATKAHGIQRNPSLNQSRDDDRALIERISLWVKSLALSQKPETTMPMQYPLAAPAISGVSTAVATIPVAKQSNRKINRPEELQQDRNAKLSKPAKSAPPTEFLSMTELADLEATIEKFEKQIGAGATANSSTKRDPFDPEVFNRQFR